VGDKSLLGKRYSDTRNTVASALRGLGYMTGMVGKWHLTPPEEVNFGDNYSKQTDSVRLSGFDFVDGLYITNMCDCISPVCLNFNHNMEWLLDRALEFMDRAMRVESPFFLYFAATPAHLPSVEDSLLGFFGPDATPSGPVRNPDISRYCSSCTLPLRKDIWDSTARISSRSEVGYCRASLAALRWLDESLGVLYDFLSERAAIGNTYIVISTDHGSAKKTLYELGIRVPLYVVGPGIRAGTRVGEVVSHIDLAPTFLAWAGCCADSSMPIPVDGLSWSSLASAGAGSLDREGVYAEYYFDRALMTRDHMKLYMSPTKTMVEAEATKWPRWSKEWNFTVTAVKNLALNVGDSYPFLYDEMQLYNMSADPLEQVNLWMPL
jgi:arylsulfatase A-like enzyme